MPNPITSFAFADERETLRPTSLGPEQITICETQRQRGVLKANYELPRHVYLWGWIEYRDVFSSKRIEPKLVTKLACKRSIPTSLRAYFGKTDRYTRRRGLEHSTTE